VGPTAIWGTRHARAKEVLVSKKTYVIGGYFLLCGLYVLVMAVQKPELNWDAIAYVAAAKAMETDRPGPIHEFAYRQYQKAVESTTQDSSAAPITEDDKSYRKAMQDNADAFMENVRFYQIRPAYTGAVFGLYKAGVQPVFATYLISAVAAFLGVGVMFVIARSRMMLPFLLALPPLALSFKLRAIASASSPDALAFLGMMICAYLFIKERKELLAVLPLLLPIRTDLAIFVVLLLGYLFLFGPYKKRWVAVSFVATVLIYEFLRWHYNYPGWTSVFYVTLVKQVIHSLSPPPLTVGQYVAVLLRGIARAANDTAFTLYAVVAILSACLLFVKKSIGYLMHSKMHVLLVLSAAYVGIHFVLFPLVWDRFFIGSYILSGIAFFSLLSERLAGDAATPETGCATQGGLSHCRGG
jgi:hypothetical protein